VAVLTSKALSTAAATLRRLGLARVNTMAKRALRDRPIRISVDGLVIEGPGTALGFLRRMESGDYEAQLTKLFVASLRPGARVLDVGAALGWYTLLAARGVGADGEVVAFEADPYACRALRRNVAANGFGNARVYERAAADRSDEQRAFFVSTTTGVSGFTRDDFDPSAETQVATVAIDDLDLGPVDVAKIDVEGSEFGVLTGMVGTLARSPGMTLFIEYNPLALAANGTDPAELLVFLAERFAVEMLDGHGGIGAIDHAAVERRGYMNLRCTPRSS
jgi:FkbM family methyltransferase